MKSTIAATLFLPLAGLAFSTSAALGADRQDTAGVDGSAYEIIRNGDLQSAERSLQAAREAGAEDPFQMLNLAYVMQKTGRSGEAAEIYRQVLEMDSNPYAAMATGESRRVKTVARQGLELLSQDLD